MLPAISYHEQRLFVPATQEVDRAIDLCLPDGLIAPLTECRNDMCALPAERLTLRSEPTARAMLTLNRQLTVGWTTLTKTIRGVIYTDSLTPREHHVAKPAARGLSNGGIAARMGLAY